MKRLLSLLLVLLSLTATAGIPDADFVRCRGAQFFTASQPSRAYYYIGANMWYAPILASKGAGGDIKRLRRELDALSAMGCKNLRILVGADSGSEYANPVQPVLQRQDGTLNDTLLRGLDRLLVEMRARDMRAVLYLTNSWDWSGGFGHYLKRSGFGPSPSAEGEGYNAYVSYASQFYHSASAQQLFEQHVARIVQRTNSLTHRPYVADPTIMAWQLCNEPRPFATDTATIGAFTRWVARTSALIKRLDPNHLVSVGSEGTVGCNLSEQLYESIHMLTTIDYLTLHIWPVNWRWATPATLTTALPRVYLNTASYLEQHQRLAERLGKPCVVEEFGYSRDRTLLRPFTPTLARDGFFRALFTALLESRAKGGALAGLNFWGWSGEASPMADRWHAGCPYLNDPPHEPQGWYSVYRSDSSTIALIKETAAQL